MRDIVQTLPVGCRVRVAFKLSFVISIGPRSRKYQGRTDVLPNFSDNSRFILSTELAIHEISINL